MRWFWIDRFTEFVAGRRAVAIKNVTLAEAHLHEYFPGYPVMPQSLILEGLAQTGGMLLGQASNFRARLVLAKVSKAIYHFAARPGDQLVYSAVLDAVGAEGALITGQCHVDGRVQADVEFYLAVLPSRDETERLFDPPSFARLLRLLGVYEVGTDADGQPLEFPGELLEAERNEP